MSTYFDLIKKIAGPHANERDVRHLGELAEAAESSGLFDDLLSKRDDVRVDRQRERIAALKTTQTRLSKAKAAAAQACAAQAQRFREAEVAFKREQQAHIAACNAAYYVDLELAGVQGTFEIESREDAPARLEQFVYRIDDILGASLPMTLTVVADEWKRQRGYFPAISSNMPDYLAAKKALEEAIAATRGKQLEALTEIEATEFLHATCERLAAPLAGVSLNPPSLTAADAEPGQPFRFAGASKWIVEDSASRPGAEDAKAQRATLNERASRSDKVS
jgi:hypothetical protein